MTSYTCRCPGLASIFLLPLTAALVLVDLAAWGQQAWIDQHYGSTSSTVWAAVVALAGPTIVIATIIRMPSSITGWRQLLRVEERTLIAVVPAFLLLVVASAAAAVI